MPRRMRLPATHRSKKRSICCSSAPYQEHHSFSHTCFHPFDRGKEYFLSMTTCCNISTARKTSCCTRMTRPTRSARRRSPASIRVCLRVGSPSISTLTIEEQTHTPQEEEERISI